MNMASCGYALDLIRSCYQSVMYPYPGAPAGQKVVWYFTDPANGFLPFPHAFGSAIWDDVLEDPPTVGERKEDHGPWSNGKQPSWANKKSYCGSVESWQGKATASTDKLAYNPDGSPACCNPLPKAALNVMGITPGYYLYPPL